MRVNARLDETTQQQLQYLTETSGHSVSQVLRDCVASRFAQVKQSKAPNRPSRFLALAGTGDSGLSDVSSNIRYYFGEALAQKYPQHLGRELDKPKSPLETKVTPKSKASAKTAVKV